MGRPLATDQPPEFHRDGPPDASGPRSTPGHRPADPADLSAAHPAGSGHCRVDLAEVSDHMATDEPPQHDADTLPVAAGEAPPFPYMPPPAVTFPLCTFE